MDASGVEIDAATIDQPSYPAEDLRLSRARRTARLRRIGLVAAAVLLLVGLGARQMRDQNIPGAAPSGAPVLFVWDDASQDRQALIDPVNGRRFATRKPSDPQPSPKLRNTSATGRLRYEVGAGDVWDVEVADGCGQVLRRPNDEPSALPERAVDLRLSDDGKVGVVMFTDCNVPARSDKYDIQASILTWTVALFDPRTPRPADSPGRTRRRTGRKREPRRGAQPRWFVAHCCRARRAR